MNAVSDIATREFRAVDQIVREVDYVDRIARQLEPFRALIENADAIAGYAREEFRIHDAFARSLRPLVAEQVLLEPAYAQDYTSTLAQSHAILSQFTAQHSAEFDLSRIVGSINAQIIGAQSVASFAERIIGDENLRHGLMNGLTSAYAAASNVAPITTFNYDEAFRTVVERFDELGLTRSESLYHVVLWQMDRWLESLPPNVRQLFIAIVAVLVGLVCQEAITIGKAALRNLPSHHEQHDLSDEDDPPSSDMCR